jgi:hypothetical protein
VLFRSTFTTASDGSLLNDAINSLQMGWNEQFYINNEILYKQTQMAALFKEAWSNSTIGTEEIWANYYSNLPNIRELQRRFSASTSPSPAIDNMNAMVKILLAYKTFKLTDLFGDVPYSEAGYGFQDVTKLRPKFDTQRSIYISLLNELKWADEHINLTETGEPYASFKTFDKLFFGNLTLWRKFANSLRLRYAVRMYDKEPAIAGQIVADIINNDKPVLIGCNFSGSILEKAAIYPSLCGFRNEGKVWSFREHKNLRMGSNMWKLLSSNDSTSGSGIFDARAYMFFDTNNESKWVPYPQIPTAATPAESGVPYMEQRNSAGGYSVKGADCLFSPFNYFLISDEVNVPDILMTGAEVHFLKAEAYMRGIGVTQSVSNADNEYLSGIQASLSFWKNTMSATTLKTDGAKFDVMIPIPAFLTLTYLQNKVGFWNFTTDDEKLSHIYSQQLIDFFKQPSEAFALVRRVYGKIPREISGNQGLLTYHRFVIPPSEVAYNQTNWVNSYSSQGDYKETKVWWMK